MKLVGFGCSFTYGSELVDPEIGPEFHHKNTHYREDKVWLGQLAEMLGTDVWSDNRSEPGNSNYAVQYQFVDWFNNNRDPNETVAVCVAWTSPRRFSWLGKKWIHNGYIQNDGETLFKNSHKDWITSGIDNVYYTDAAKLFVNSVCNLHNIPIVQFNAIGIHKSTSYKGYFMDGMTMKGCLQDAMKSDDRLDLFASGGHPNEAGHEYFTIRLTDFAKDRIIV